MGVRLVKPGSSPTDASAVNVSTGGVCLRLSEPLEIHSRVRLQLTLDREVSRSEKGDVQCAGRVAWVMQRLDLRNTPPFLFDVGIEFIDPPAVVRQWLMPGQAQAIRQAPARPRQQTSLEPFVTHQRRFVPKLSRESKDALWHLVVAVDGVPCFSGHYPTERTALEALAKFHRQQARSRS